jgi:hypothetical protein
VSPTSSRPRFAAQGIAGKITDNSAGTNLTTLAAIAEHLG